MTLYSLVDILTGVFEAILIFIILNTYLEKKDKSPVLIIGAGIVALAILINLSNHIFNFGLLNLVGMVLSIFIISYMFSGTIKTRIITSILSILIIILCELITMFMITSIGNITTAESIGNPQLRLLGIVISKLLTFGVVKIITFNKIKMKSYLKTSYWLLFFMILSTSILAIYLIFKLQYDSDITSMNFISVICSFGLLYSTFFSLYLYENMGRQSEIISQQKMYEQQIKDQSKHFDEILLAQSQLKSFRHDLSNHLISLKSYFENRDYSQGLVYIKNIDNTMSINTGVLDTGNAVLDAILNTKKSIAESKNIKFILNIQIPESIPIEATDICVIWGNALDNAIEACDKLSSSSKQIKVSIICERNTLICKVSNTCTNSGNLNLKTTKKDKNKHGFGLKNIKTTLGKYGSVFRIAQNNDEFVLSFIIVTNK